MDRDENKLVKSGCRVETCGCALHECKLIFVEGNMTEEKFRAHGSRLVQLLDDV